MEKNVLEDSLSKRDQLAKDSKQNCCDISIVSSQWVQDLKSKICTTIFNKDNQEEDARRVTEFWKIQDVDGLICYKGRILIDHTNASVIKTLMQESLFTIRGGGVFHFRAKRTCHINSQVFYWKDMKSHVETYIKECDTCQKNKSENINISGHLRPLPIPKKIRTGITMDFIINLPKISTG